MVFNVTFNNFSVISWRSFLLVGEAGVPGETHRPVASQWQTLSYNVVSSTPRHKRDYIPKKKYMYLFVKNKNSISIYIFCVLFCAKH